MVTITFRRRIAAPEFVIVPGDMFMVAITTAKTAMIIATALIARTFLPGLPMLVPLSVRTVGI